MDIALRFSLRASAPSFFRPPSLLLLLVCPPIALSSPQTPSELLTLSISSTNIGRLYLKPSLCVPRRRVALYSTHFSSSSLSVVLFVFIVWPKNSWSFLSPEVAPLSSVKIVFCAFLFILFFNTTFYLWRSALGSHSLPTLSTNLWSFLWRTLDPATLLLCSSKVSQATLGWLQLTNPSWKAKRSHSLPSAVRRLSDKKCLAIRWDAAPACAEHRKSRV